jgi:hypothetical protein
LVIGRNLRFTFNQVKKLNKEEYPSPYNFDSQEIIKKMVDKEAYILETLYNLKGRAGNPKPEPCEISFS